MNKILYIPRGVPGSGKSSLITSILEGDADSLICSADHYFYKNGNGVYSFDASKLWIAHKECLSNCEKGMVEGIGRIAVDNTFVSEKDMKPYQALAEKYGYQVFVFVVENRHNNTSIHDVPQEKRVSMEAQLRNSIKLI